MISSVQDWFFEEESFDLNSRGRSERIKRIWKSSRKVNFAVTLANSEGTMLLYKNFVPGAEQLERKVRVGLSSR
jgi:hypothetical protein